MNGCKIWQLKNIDIYRSLAWRQEKYAWNKKNSWNQINQEFRTPETEAFFEFYMQLKQVSWWLGERVHVLSI